MNALNEALKIHVALNVGNIEASIAFYQKLFSIEPVKVRKGYAKFDVSFPAVNLSLNQADQETPKTGALSHLGIQVPTSESVLAIRQQWVNAGLMPRDEMQTTCCFALQDKAWVNDPDGNAWEVFVVLEDNLSASDANSCCGNNDSLVAIDNFSIGGSQ